jgi:hypothetical protein
VQNEKVKIENCIRVNVCYGRGIYFCGIGGHIEIHYDDDAGKGAKFSQ